ncbi:hypothetical protein N7493_001066 [Penicillium malachiteum]|uniref:ABC-2 type transporter transmembrane domain-containing protein n=1 Tax=Penicillium malachiteum TaxID=1324776 RepID=A0AAD6HYS4_9EURO|nr:hypothetical protein N7493_001066 [Penicillium malachiteum]
MFDRILLLGPGGRTVYFGKTGENSSKVVDYFGRHGAVIGEDVNPAEFILSKSTMRGDQSIDWPAVWDECEEKKVCMRPLTTSIVKPDKTSMSFLRRQILKIRPQQPEVDMHFHSGPNFFKAGSSVQGLQNSMVAILLLSWIVPATCTDLQDIWFRKLDLFTAREKNGIYDWKPLVTALIAVELPWQVGTYSLIFLSTYWTVVFPNVPAIAGFNYFTWLLLAIFGTGYSKLLVTVFPNPLMGGYANSLFWVILMVVSGVLTPHSYINVFYRVRLFWADPMRYLFGATVGTVLHDVKLHCKSSDLTLSILHLVRHVPRDDYTATLTIHMDSTGGTGRYFLGSVSPTLL